MTLLGLAEEMLDVVQVVEVLLVWQVETIPFYILELWKAVVVCILEL